MKMMMTPLLALGLLLFLGISSCAHTDDLLPDTVFLTLSGEEVQLPTGGVKDPLVPQIAYESNWEGVEAVSLSGKWLSAEVREGGIYISALPNRSSSMRKGAILVNAGTQRKLITVSQANSTLTLKVTPTEAVISRDGETLLMDVKSNGATDWNLEPNEDAPSWLKINRIGGFLEVIAEANPTANVRTAQAFIRTEGKVYEILFLQEAGLKTEKYALPLIERTSSLYNIIAFEENQGNHLLYMEFGGSILGSKSDNKVVVAYETNLYNSVTYTVDPKTSVIKNIRITSNKPEELKSQEFLGYLEDRGFSISKNNSTVPQVHLFSGYNSEAAYAIEMKVNDSPDVLSEIVLKSRGRQAKPYETFKSFPYDKVEYLNPQWTYDAIKKQELSDGATLAYETKSDLAPSGVREAQFDTDASQKPVVARIMGMNETEKDPSTGKILDKLSQLVVVYEDMHLGAFVADDGRYYLTEEFQSLLVKEGFVYYYEKNFMTYWYNDALKLIVVPRGVRFNTVLKGKAVLAISFFKGTLNTNVSASTMRDPDPLISKIDREIRAVDASLEKLSK